MQNDIKNKLKYLVKELDRLHRKKVAVALKHLNNHKNINYEKGD